MQASKTTSGICCRRRTLTNKILPAILQAVIAVALWESLKSMLPSSESNSGNSPINNIRSLGEIKCPTAEISYSKIVTLLDLSSVINPIETAPRNKPHTYHSKVDIYVKDGKQDNLILYPAGSLVVLGLEANIAEKIITSDTVDKIDSVEIDDDVDEASDAKYKSVNRDDILSAKVEAISQIRSSNALQNANYDSKGKAEDRVERFKPEVALSQQGIRSAALHNDASFRVAENQQKTIVRSSSNVIMPQSNKQSGESKSVESYGQSDPFELLRKLDEKLSKNMALVDSSKAQDLGGFDTKRLGNEKPNYRNQFGYGSQDTANNAETKLVSRGIMLDETGERLYADGFSERVSKVSVEMFGKSMSKISPNQKPIKLVMNNPSLCTAVKDIEVLFLINSIAQNIDLRQRIRDTFVNPAYFRDVKIAHVFLVGKTASAVAQQSLYQEHSAHQDIVQGDFLDAPENDTVKGLVGMRWVTQYCFLAKYIMKINDVVFVDTDKLVHGLIPATKKITGKRTMLCDFTPESEIIRFGPNGISPDLFPGRSHLRPYCKGFAVLLTRGAVSSLLAASEYVPSIHLDELYLYGILPFVSGTVDVFDVGKKRAFNILDIETVNCYKTLKDNCPFVASVSFDGRFTDLWDMVRARMRKPHNGWENESSLWDIENYKRQF